MRLRPMLFVLTVLALPAAHAMAEPTNAALLPTFPAPAIEPIAADRSAEPAASPSPETPRTVDPVDRERETLARLAAELLLLQADVHDAARRAPTLTRVQFRYDWLESDLGLIERAIRDHLDAPRQPRPVTPLKGDYRR